MIAQNLSESVGLNFTESSPIVKLMLNGVIKVYGVQPVLIVILNAHEKVVGLSYVCLAYSDWFFWRCYLDSPDLGILISIDEQDVITQAWESNKWPADAESSQRTEDVVAVHLVLLCIPIPLHLWIDFWKRCSAGRNHFLSAILISALVKHELLILVRENSNFFLLNIWVIIRSKWV